MTGSARAMVLEEPRQLVERTFALPEIGDNDALLRVEACGLCGTDHEQYTGLLFAGFGFIPGHESVGVIEQIGEEAAERWEVHAGDRVALEVFLSCHACDACRSGVYRRCERHGLSDMYGYIPVSKEPSLWGGYAEYQYLAPDSMLLPVPDGIDPVVATVFNPLGAGVRWGVTVPETSEGDIVVIMGPGIRGLCAAAAAKEAGAGFVMVTGLGDRDAPRLEAAYSFGADLALDVGQTDPVAALHAAVGRRADVVLDVTAKAPAAFAQAIELVERGGTVVVAGTRGWGDAPGFRPDTIVYKEIRVIGALGVDVEAYRVALDLLASQKYPFESLLRRTAGLDEVESLLQVMAGDTAEIPPIHGVVIPGAPR